MSPAPQLQIVVVVSDLFGENCYIAHLEGRSDCLVFDPGLEPDRVIRYIDDKQLKPAAFMVTHGHADHIAGLIALKKRWPECPTVIGSGDADKLTDPRKNLSAGFGLPLTVPPADVLVEHGQAYTAAGLTLEVRAIPGHSSGHVVFVWREGEPAIVFGGDVLFAGGVGRTDFPDGSFEQLAAGIRDQLFTLPDDTVLLSGHGPETTIGEERRTNPFVGATAGG